MLNSDVVVAECAARLRQIPHLPLGLTYDADRIAAEYAALMPGSLVPYRSSSSSEYVREFLAESWNGVCLTGPAGDAHRGLTELSYSSRSTMAFRPTPLARLCPYTMSVVKEIGCLTMLNRIMRVNPGGSLSWHSHHYDFGASPDSHTIHVPITVPPNFFYSVTDFFHYKMGNHIREPIVYHNQTYPPGQATMFNCWHMHNVFNESDKPRLSLMMYVSLYDKNTCDILMAAADRYDGPFIHSKVVL